MHDNQLEDRLRTILRTEGDGLPMTITPAELERRLAVRQRQNRGRTLTAIAAVIAFVAVAAIAAMSNGWLRLPAVGVSPSPSATSPSATPSPTTESTASLEPSAQSEPPFSPRNPIGGGSDAVIVKRVQGLPKLEVDLVHPDSTVALISTLDTSAFPAGYDVSTSDRMLLSPSGYLLIPLANGDDERGGAALYDLHDPTAHPRFLTDVAARGYAWSPTDLLAAIKPNAVDVIHPGDTSAPIAIAIPADVSLLRHGARDLFAWSADDPTGLVAARDDSAGQVRGVLGLDGSFTVEASPQAFAPTGLERDMDLGGRRLAAGCDASGDGANGGCGVTSFLPDRSTQTVWYSDNSGDGTIGDEIWAADGKTIWLMLDRRKGVAKTRTIVLRTGGPKVYTDVASVKDVALADSGLPGGFAGFNSDESRIAVDLGDGEILLVDRATGESARVAGQFAGWGDPLDAAYPNLAP